MMDRIDVDVGRRVGIAGGTLLAVFTNLGEDMVRTVVLTATGAVVSFVVSSFVRWLVLRWRR